jgi:transposase
MRRQMIELVRAGRTPEQVAKEFEPSGQAIRNWVAQADRDEGRREDGLTTVEREGLNRLRRENRQLKLEREILSNLSEIGTEKSLESPAIVAPRQQFLRFSTPIVCHYCELRTGRDS